MSSKHHQTGLSRRQFFVRTAFACGAALGAGVLGSVFYSDNPVRRKSEKIYTFKNYRIPESGEHPCLVIAQGKNPEKITRAALHKLGGMARFVSPGDRVLIKPNVGWDRQPEQAANTNPEIVAAVVGLCREARASEVWVTDVSINDPYRSFSRSGIESAVRKAGGTVKYNTEKDFVSTDLKGAVLRVWPVSRFYHEADKIINIPKVKHHSLSRCTIAMKNWYGILGGPRNLLHQDIHTSIVDLAAAVRPTLTVIDATLVLFRNGPTGGNLSDVAVEDTVIAGTDEVAMDSYSLKYLNIHAQDVPFLQMGQTRGLGVVEWKSLNPVTVNI